MTVDHAAYLRERGARIRLAFFAGYLHVTPSPKLYALLTNPPLPDDLPAPDEGHQARRSPRGQVRGETP